MMDSTEDTHQYIVVHQATLRNRVCLILIMILSLMTIKLSQLMWLSLTMEGCLISTAAGTVISASFGMNLQSGVHENTYVSSNLLRKMIIISLNKCLYIDPYELQHTGVQNCKPEHVVHDARFHHRNCLQNLESKVTADQQFSFSIFHDSCGQLATLSCILIESRSQARHWSRSQLLGFEEFLHLCGRPRISCENQNQERIKIGQNKYLRKQVFNKKEINRSEFKEAVEKVTSLKVRQESVF